MRSSRPHAFIITHGASTPRAIIHPFLCDRRLCQRILLAGNGLLADAPSARPTGLMMCSTPRGSPAAYAAAQRADREVAHQASGARLSVRECRARVVRHEAGYPHLLVQVARDFAHGQRVVASLARQVLLALLV